jgi:glucokinase
VILAGDIGGTKCVMALFESGANGELRAVREQVFPSAENDSLVAILDKFLRPREAEALAGACFGVAGPVVDHVAKITNLPWTISAPALTARFGGLPVGLINDLQATALGSLVLPPEKFCVLQDASPPASAGMIAVIAPGTGLGEAFLAPDRHAVYRSIASEGGHADFAPGTDEEIELLKFLRKKYAGHVSYERVLSGAGIGDLYDFVRATRGDHEPAWLAAKIASGDRNAAVSEAALAKTDEACVHALDMFCEILGAEAGNLALRSMSTSGVVIGGGIPPKILPALQAGGLVKRFNDKGRFEKWTRTIAVRVALEPRAALLGAAHYVATSKDQRS